MSDEYLDYDALGLAELIRNGETTQRDILEVTLRRIEALDDTINAMTTLSYERALARIDQIQKDSIFAGVPSMMKDFIDVAGIRRTDCSKANLTRVCTDSSDYVRAFEAAGLNIVGMTNMPEFASLIVADNESFGPTRNPWDLTRTAGGSSGGSAAAVAAGYTPIVHGTDGGGSNRLPSSWCGLLGMKPSRYRMLCGEIDGVHMLFRTHQSISRSVRDSAALFAATENTFKDCPYPPIGRVKGPSKKRLKIALTTKNSFGQEPEPDIKAAIEDTALLCESLGHEVEQVDNPILGEAFFEAYVAMFFYRFKGMLKPFETLTGKPAEKAGILSPATVSMLRKADAITEEEYSQGEKYRKELESVSEKLFKRYDVWLTPVCPYNPPKVGYFSPFRQFQDMREEMQKYMSLTPFANVVGNPAMSVPLSWSHDEGLPIGSHFIAKVGDDKTLYELAFELEEARPWFNKWAPFSAKHTAY